MPDIAQTLPTAAVTGSPPPMATTGTPPAKTGPRAGIGRKWLYHGMTIITGLALGFSALILAHKYMAARLFPAPEVRINYALITTPNSHLVQDVYVPEIKTAQKQILVMAREISSRMLLEALQAKSMNGVDVEILLSPSEDNEGTLRWAKEHGVDRVYVDSQPMDDQLILIDGTKVILTALPFTADAAAGIQSVGVAVEDAGLGRKISAEFFQRISQPSGVQ
jgi:phosphatidylserine/phosphatidylglycerophosphate/cardiolipin synthase-like enzyme